MWTVEEAKETEQSTYETLEICQKDNTEVRHTIKHILGIIKEGH